MSNMTKCNVCSRTEMQSNNGPNSPRSNASSPLLSTDTLATIKKVQSKYICNSCRNLFYRSYQKLIKTITEKVTDIDSQVHIIKDCILANLKSTELCQNKSIWPELCEDLMCSKCRFRKAIFMFDLPSCKYKSVPPFNPLKYIKFQHDIKKYLREIKMTNEQNVITNVTSVTQLSEIPNVNPLVKLDGFFNEIQNPRFAFNYYFKNPVNEQYQPLHVFPSKATQRNETTSGSTVSAVQLTKLPTESATLIQQIHPFIGSLITVEQAKSWPKILNDQTNFFKATLYSLLLNTYKHGNFNDERDISGDKLCQELATFINSEYFLVHQYIQVLASYVNGEWHYTPFGIFRRNQNAVFTLFVECYGLEKGTQVFNLYVQAAEILQNYPKYKLAMILMCTVFYLFKKNPQTTVKYENVKRKQVNEAIVDLLISHLKIMASNMNMGADVETFQKLLDMDWSRINKIRFKIDSHCTVSTRW